MNDYMEQHVWNNYLGPSGDFYNSAMQSTFGDYRFSDTLGESTFINQYFLDNLHLKYEEYKNGNSVR